MPEGDTVYHTAAVLHEALVGATVQRSDFRVPQLATVDLAGYTVQEWRSRGKHLLLRLTRPERASLTLHSHLRMDGSWRAFALSEQPTRLPHTVRVALYTTRAVAIGYDVKDLSLVPTDGEEQLIGRLGPDLLGPDWDAAEAVRRLRAVPDRPIGEALLDQTNLAGIGNLYKSEILFLRGVFPWRPVGDIADLDAMVALAHRLLMANRDRWTQSTTGLLHRGQTTYVYGRRAQPCRRCGTPIAKAEQADRVTYWCPTCQPNRA